MVLKLFLFISAFLCTVCYTSLAFRPLSLGSHRGARDALFVTVDSSSISSCELIVWDCDGVLVDSEALLKQGEVEALARAGFSDVTVEDCVRMFSGVSPDQATANFLKEKGRPLPEHFFRDQIAGSMQLFRDRLQPLMKDTVLRLRDKGVRMCVASGSPRSRVLLCLDVAGIGECFTANSVFTREQVSRGKPAPDLFLLAAEKMGVSPDKCIVVEDASAGIEAADAAKMSCIGYLGGGHTKASWYRDKILSYKIPIAHTQEEVYNMLTMHISKLR